MQKLGKKEKVVYCPVSDVCVTRRVFGVSSMKSQPVIMSDMRKETVQ